MCGIFGCILQSCKQENIIKLIMTALNLLKNRGYDSCGIFIESNDMNYLYKLGIDEHSSTDIFILLENKLKELINPLSYYKGIGHTRWATHGNKTDFNAHPHFSNNKSIHVVHNGIISNCNELKLKYLSNYTFYSETDTEVIANMLEYFTHIYPELSFEMLLEKLNNIMEGTWACIINYESDKNRLYFMKNETPLLIGSNDNICMLVSEPSGFMNKVDKYILLREKTYGYVDKIDIKIFGDHSIIKLDMIETNDMVLDKRFDHWMIKEIHNQVNLNVLVNPLNNSLRYNDNIINLNYDFIKDCKYLYIIGCGSSYYAGCIAANYFRYTKAFEFVNVFDGGEFNSTHLEAIENPERDLLIILISQSGETRDLNIATTICREFSSNRKYKLQPNKLLQLSDPINELFNNKSEKSTDNYDEIKIIGIINVIGSLISRRTIDNLYTNCGRENAVASTKSCTSQILACLLLAIYKSKLSNLDNDDIIKLRHDRFYSDLLQLKGDINNVIIMNNKIKMMAENILERTEKNNIKHMFLLGKDELQGVALEGALKIKEIAYIHAEGFHLSALKHGPYAMIENGSPIILIYKSRDHFVKCIIEEVKTRGAIVYEISYDALEEDNSIILPRNKTFIGLLAVIVLQLLSYNLSVLKGINPDRPRNLAKVVTVD